MTQFWTNDLISRTVQNCEDCGIRMVFEALHASYSFGIIYANEQNQSRSFFLSNKSQVHFLVATAFLYANKLLSFILSVCVLMMLFQITTKST